MGLDNAFDPDNEHLWLQCETHRRDQPGEKRCIFVTDCEACKVFCMHKSQSIHDILAEA